MPTFEETNNPNLQDLDDVSDTEQINSSAAAYQVGVTTDNKITLRIGDNFSSHTLTMNEPAARKLIRILEAAIESSDEEDQEE